MPYLKCDRCGLSIRSRNPLTDRQFCPRCRARGDTRPLLRSPLALRWAPRPARASGADASAAP